MGTPREWISWAFSSDIVIHISTFLFGLIISSVLAWTINTEGWLNKGIIFALCSFFLVLITLLNLGAYYNSRNKIDQFAKSLNTELDKVKLSAKIRGSLVKVSSNQSDYLNAKIFNSVLRSVDNAEDSIHVLSSTPTSSSEPNEARENYFSEFTNIVERKLSSGKDLTYSRIVQSGNEVNGTELALDNDDCFKDHCKVILGKNNHLLTPVFSRIPPLLRGIDLFVIDNNKLIILLPRIERNKNTLDASSVGVGIFFSDASGKLPQKTQHLLRKLNSYAEAFDAVA